MTQPPAPDGAPGASGGAAPRAEAAASPGGPEAPFPVRVLSAKIGSWIDRLGRVWVEGQVAQLTLRPGAGTAYLVLRDTEADVSVQVTVPRGVLDALPVPLAEGARVVVLVKPTWWARRGQLMLAATAVRPVGIGELLARLESLKRVLAAEGLFAAEHKRPLPFLPRKVGLVSGRASAAMTDVLENARLRWPGVGFEVREVVVQGPPAVAAVSAALAELDADPDVDVIVIARGGGSFEDLLPFSDEALVRAVAAATTPVVSAIGHEQDSPLLDLVADVRASTPTDAARRVVPDVREERARVARWRDGARAAVTGRLTAERRALATLRAHPALRDPASLLTTRAREVDELRERSRRDVGHRLDRARSDVAGLVVALRSLSPQGTLARGYAVVRTAEGHVVRDPAEVSPGEELDVRLAIGGLVVEVLDADLGPDVELLPEWSDTDAVTDHHGSNSKPGGGPGGVQ